MLCRGPQPIPGLDMFKLVHYEACTVGKQAVYIWLRSLLVTTRNEVGARLCFHRCVWFCSQGRVSASVHAGIHNPLGADTPQSRPPQSRHPQSRHPPEADTPQEQTLPPWIRPPRADTPPPAEHAGRYGQRAGGTHPTGMQSCSIFVFAFLVRLIQCGPMF